MQALRSAMFLIYGNANFTRAAFLDHSKYFDPSSSSSSLRGAEGDGEVAGTSQGNGNDMNGKTCVVTGANQGIGKAAAQLLASRGANVHIVCRNKERGLEAAQEIIDKTQNQNVKVEVCDLSSMSQIRRLAKTFTERDSPVHVLVNNAGIMEQKHTKSEDGFELNFAVNVLGTFLLTELLLPALERAAPEAKVITVATGGILTQPLSTDLEMEKKFDGTEAYARNKRVQVALTEKWADVYGQSGVKFVTMHPGWVDTTTLQLSMPGFYKTFKSSLRTPEEGADTIAWLSSAPNTILSSGAFYFDRKEATKHLPLARTAHKQDDVDAIYFKLKEIAKIGEN